MIPQTTPSSASSKTSPPSSTPSADLLGHSYGALCALKAALLTDNIRGLILYEGDISTQNDRIYPLETVEGMKALLKEGDRDGMITVLMELAGLSFEEISYLRSQPSGRDTIR